MAFRNSRGVNIREKLCGRCLSRISGVPAEPLGQATSLRLQDLPSQLQPDSSQQLWLEPSDGHPAPGSWKEWSCQQKRPRIEAQKGHACWCEFTAEAPGLRFRRAGRIMWGKQEPHGDSSPEPEGRHRKQHLDSLCLRQSGFSCVEQENGHCVLQRKLNWPIKEDVVVEEGCPWGKGRRKSTSSHRRGNADSFLLSTGEDPASSIHCWVFTVSAGPPPDSSPETGWFPLCPCSL